MRNERLREAIQASGLSFGDLGGDVGVDAKTAQRWVYEGRVPRRATAERVAHRLAVPLDWLWPNIDGRSSRMPADFVRLYAHRADAPRQLWLELVQTAEHRVDILSMTGHTLKEENPEIAGRLRRKAEAGVRLRIVLSHPRSTALRRCGEEQHVLRALLGRAHGAQAYFEVLRGVPGVEVRRHKATVYASIFRFDDQMLVNQHLFGTLSTASPLLHLCRETQGGLFDLFMDSYDRCWDESAIDDAGTSAA